MKVILLSDVVKVGRKFDVKEVADGFATNYLIPRRLAEIATAKKISVLEVKKTQEAEKAAVQSKLLHEDLQKLAGKTVRVSAKANAQGHLFKGVHSLEVLSAIEKEFAVVFPEGALQLPEPIKEIGEYTLTVSAGGEEAMITAVVEGEK